MNHILIVCDDAKTTEFLESRLRFQGSQVSTAVDVMAGFKQVIERKPDLVIVDICMLSGGGFLFTKRLRDKLPKTRIILIATCEKSNLTELVHGVGAVGCIEAPYQSENIKASVSHALATQPPPVILEGPPPESQPAVAEPAVTSELGATATVPHPPAQRARINGRHAILVVEDDRRIAQALSLRLRAAGQDVMLAFDAPSALITFRKAKPDLVLLDISLPGGDGLKVAERIQSMGLRQPPIIFLTASCQPGLREEAMAHGASAYLEKPYEADELIAAIRDALHSDSEP